MLDIVWALVKGIVRINKNNGTQIVCYLTTRNRSYCLILTERRNSVGELAGQVQ